MQGKDPIQRKRVDVENGIVFDDVTLEEITKFVKEIDVSKDSCITGITIQILKDAVSYIPD